MSSSNPVIVTALYDLGRGSMKKEANNHRPFSYYLDWFKHLLRVNAGMVIFIPPKGQYSGNIDLEEFIRANRDPKQETQIIIRPFTELPLYRKRDRIGNVMQYLPTHGVNYPNLEFHLPDYIILIYSKFNFLEEAIISRPECKYFFWVDAGYFRKNPGTSITLPWPDPDKIEILQDKLLLQNSSLHLSTEEGIQISKITKEEKRYLKTCPNEVIACFFGGRRDTLLWIKRDILTLLDQMLEENIVNNEQQALSVLARRYPKKFLLYPKEGDGRELLAAMASGGYLKINYPICKKLKAFTVVTKEIKESDFQAWVDTAKYYGYDYQVLGRDEKWNGWPYRTQKYLQALQEVQASHKVAILADGTDLFFCAAAEEAYRKFKQTGKDIIIGTENIIAYKESAGRHTSYQIEEFFIQQCKSRFCFPNGGFIIGKIPALIKLMQLNLQSNDDQAGYMDLAYEEKIKYDLDESNTFIANLPNYHHYTARDIGFWKWDAGKRRYYNPHTKQYPIALHFPGKNTNNQNLILNKVFPLSGSQIKNRQNNLIYWFLMIILFFILLLGIFWAANRFIYCR